MNEYLVGPVKGVYEKIPPNTNNKAREHVLLVNDRPAYVTILTLGESSLIIYMKTKLRNVTSNFIFK